MPFAFFSVSVSFPTVQQDALNQFLTSHRILRVEKSFHQNSQDGFWSFCVEWIDSGPDFPSVAKGTSQVDFKAILTEVQFQVFSQLRTVRKQLSQKDGVPVYAVATNEQLATMVRDAVNTMAGLLKVPGFGEGKASRFGTEFLAVLNQHADKLLPLKYQLPAEPSDATPTPN